MTVPNTAKKAIEEVVSDNSGARFVGSTGDSVVEDAWQQFVEWLNKCAWPGTTTDQGYDSVYGKDSEQDPDNVKFCWTNSWINDVDCYYFVNVVVDPQNMVHGEIETDASHENPTVGPIPLVVNGQLNPKLKSIFRRRRPLSDEDEKSGLVWSGFQKPLGTLV